MSMHIRTSLGSRNTPKELGSRLINCYLAKPDPLSD